MARGTDRPDREPDPGMRAEPDAPDDAGVGAIRAEPEPEWADAIRRGRRTRSQLLRSVFASFDEQDGAVEAPQREGP